MPGKFAAQGFRVSEHIPGRANTEPAAVEGSEWLLWGQRGYLKHGRCWEAPPQVPSPPSRPSFSIPTPETESMTPSSFLQAPSLLCLHGQSGGGHTPTPGPVSSAFCPITLWLQPSSWDLNIWWLRTTLCFTPVCLKFLATHLSLFYYVNLSLFPSQALSLPLFQQFWEQFHVDIFPFYKEPISREACNSPLPAETRRNSFFSPFPKAVHVFLGSFSRGSTVRAFYISSPWKLNGCPSFRLSLAQCWTCPEGLDLQQNQFV